jgi:hypothetical protein
MDPNAKANKVVEEIESHILKRYDLINKQGNSDEFIFDFRKGSLWCRLQGCR